MSVLVLNRDWAAKVRAERGAEAESRWDEVWNGVTVIMPEADNEHDNISTFFIFVFKFVFLNVPECRVHGRVNVSDRVVGWTKNYRVPDVSVFSEGNMAKDCRTHFCGGPDLALEIVSPDDRSRDKLDFYATVGTREVLVLDRDPWQLELFQLRRGKMKSAGIAKPGDAKSIASGVLPFEFQLIRSRPRPKVKIAHTETGQEWVG